jgi:hypothetical protein
MALWQFTVIAVLMGALLVHTSFLTLKMGRASAALKRIEATLLSKGEVVTPAPTAPVEATQPLEPTDMEDSTAPYLTIRDLKVRSERQRSHATASLESPAAPDMSGRFASLLFGRAKNESPEAASVEGGDTPNISAAPDTSTEAPSLHAGHAENGNSAASESESALAPSTESHDALSTSIEPPAHTSENVTENSISSHSESAGAPGSESADAPDASTELPSSHVSLAENENSLPPTSETGDAPNASSEPPHSPAATPATNEDTVEQREREALLFQSNQRRRRRARQGY